MQNRKVPKTFYRTILDRGHSSLKRTRKPRAAETIHIEPKMPCHATAETRLRKNASAKTPPQECHRKSATSSIVPPQGVPTNAIEMPLHKKCRRMRLLQHKRKRKKKTQPARLPASGGHDHGHHRPSSKEQIASPPPPATPLTQTQTLPFPSYHHRQLHRAVAKQQEKRQAIDTHVPRVWCVFFLLPDVKT